MFRDAPSLGPGRGGMLAALPLDPPTATLVSTLGWSTVGEALCVKHMPAHAALGITPQGLCLAQQRIAAAVLSCDRSPQHVSGLVPRVYSTGSHRLDASLGGGLPAGCVTELVGVAGSGKTQACLVAAVQCALDGGRAIYIDTANALQRSRLSEAIKRRLHDAPSGYAWSDTVLDRIVVHCVYDIFSLLDTLCALREGPHIDMLIIDSVQALLRPHHSEDSTKANKSDWAKIEPLVAQAMLLLKHLLASDGRDGEGAAVGSVLLTSLLSQGIRSSRIGSTASSCNRSDIVGQSLSLNLNPGNSLPVVEGRFSCWTDTVDLAVLVAPVEASVAESHNCGVVGIIKQPHWVALSAGKQFTAQV